jgi:hypothetical protein
MLANYPGIPIILKIEIFHQTSVRTEQSLLIPTNNMTFVEILEASRQFLFQGFWAWVDEVEIDRPIVPQV